MSAYLRQEMGQPWCVTRRLRFERLLYPEAWKPALLDHQELLGNQVGRARVLSPLQGTRHVRNEHDGLRRDDSNLVKKVFGCLKTRLSSYGYKVLKLERSVYQQTLLCYNPQYFRSSA